VIFALAWLASPRANSVSPSVWPAGRTPRSSMMPPRGSHSPSTKSGSSPGRHRLFRRTSLRPKDGRHVATLPCRRCPPAPPVRASGPRRHAASRRKQSLPGQCRHETTGRARRRCHCRIRRNWPTAATATRGRSIPPQDRSAHPSVSRGPSSRCLGATARAPRCPHRASPGRRSAQQDCRTGSRLERPGDLAIIFLAL
jgi:hypothetical protein